MPFWKEPSSPTRQDRRRGYFLGQSQSRAPTPAKPLYHSFYSPNGGASLMKTWFVRLPGGGILLCRQKDAKAVQGCALKTRSPCCAGYEFRFFGHEKSESVLHADGLKKSLRRIFIAAALERRTANHHPCPLLKGGGLRGRKANNLRSAAHLSANHSPAPQPPRPSPSASPNIPRAPNCRPALARPSEPLSRLGKGGGGKGQMRCGYLGSDSVRSTD